MALLTPANRNGRIFFVPNLYFIGGKGNIFMGMAIFFLCNLNAWSYIIMDVNRKIWHLLNQYDRILIITIPEYPVWEKTVSDNWLKYRIHKAMNKIKTVNLPLCVPWARCNILQATIGFFPSPPKSYNLNAQTYNNRYFAHPRGCVWACVRLVARYVVIIFLTG